MIPFFIIISGILLCFFGFIKLLSFMDKFSKKIDEINSLYGSDVFKSYADLRLELDELNFSYYEILGRQDERIDKIENSLSAINIDNSLKAESKNISLKTKSENEENKEDINFNYGKEADNIYINNKETNPNDLMKKKILALYESGKSTGEISSLLKIGTGTVDLICSLYGGEKRR